ncbi:IclR family transcriptional regulator [Aneurinibacillus sp. Ricciae_BoGa-3]|uniref:IclR family transcriptional regulator n=1 Tax=Aneurinibacillus sp. Ricciae_BoGa-3 TaxID=3022697 RepID=UPI0023423562|nr:IclR family transcriptional regulator [Aneurinibacillus sp. Ricciae_BoGa-3]WCK56669.1 IclR family transcriptional regulator [Aneurinibacillus sp. Ricciae_BoGa-3]
MMGQPELLASVQNAIRIMREFSFDEPELGITELSKRLGLSKSAVYRILQTLCTEEIVQRNPRTRKYFLGITAFEIGCVVYNDIEVCEVALPLLNKLMNRVRGVIQLAMYDRGSIVYLLKLPEDKETKVFNRMGKRVPAHATASGKVLLAFQNKNERDSVCSGKLQPLTSYTITDQKTLQNELHMIPEKGYALSKEEFKLGMYSVAAPIFDEITKQIIAAISITGTRNLFSHSQIQAYVYEMKHYSRLISEQLRPRERVRSTTTTLGGP